MSLVFAAITPHPPLLIPTIGKEETKKVKKTEDALHQLEEDLYLAKPDTIVIISPHATIVPGAFAINMCPDYETDLRDFGDLTTKLKFHGDINLASKIFEAAKDKGIPVSLSSNSLIDHGAAVPLYFVASHLSGVNIVPITFSDLEWKAHMEFGAVIKDQIMNNTKRVAVIASGDMSHALTSDSPAGFNKAGAEFDKKIQELLAAGNAAGMLQLDPKFVEDAAECGFRSFLILMGILHDIQRTCKIYSYECPFGVGYLTANFVL